MVGLFIPLDPGWMYRDWSGCLDFSNNIVDKLIKIKTCASVSFKAGYITIYISPWMSVFSIYWWLSLFLNWIINYYLSFVKSASFHFILRQIQCFYWITKHKDFWVMPTNTVNFLPFFRTVVQNVFAPRLLFNSGIFFYSWAWRNICITTCYFLWQRHLPYICFNMRKRSKKNLSY